MTTTKLLARRLLWILASALITGLITYFTGDYKDAAWYPVVYLVLTTARDFLDKSIPNK